MQYTFFCKNLSPPPKKLNFAEQTFQEMTNKMKGDKVLQSRINYLRDILGGKSIFYKQFYLPQYLLKGFICNPLNWCRPCWEEKCANTFFILIRLQGIYCVVRQLLLFCELLERWTMCSVFLFSHGCIEVEREREREHALGWGGGRDKQHKMYANKYWITPVSYCEYKPTAIRLASQTHISQLSEQLPIL